MEIGFIGLGIMGKPMVKHLLKANYHVYVYDINKGFVDEMKSYGAIGTDTISELSNRSDVIITMLPNGDVVSKVLFDEGGVIESIKKGTIVIDMSSVSPVESKEFAVKLRANEVEFIDAPVSGGEPMAISAELSIMVGGNKEVVDSVMPILNVLGKNVKHIGEVGAGSTTKLINQVLVSIHLAALAEAYTLAEKSNVDLEKVFEVVSQGLAGSAVLDAKMNSVLNRDFEPGGKIETNLKDLRNIQKTADSLTALLPLTNMVTDMFKTEYLYGNKEKDHSFIINYYERINNIEG